KQRTLDYDSQDRVRIGAAGAAVADHGCGDRSAHRGWRFDCGRTTAAEATRDRPGAETWGRSRPTGASATSRAGSAPADLCAMGEVLWQGPGPECEAGVLHRKRRSHRSGPSGDRRGFDRARGRAEENPARDIAEPGAAAVRHPHHRRPGPAADRTVLHLL